MSLFALAAGTLVADPHRREGAKGRFATATLKVAADSADAILGSVIAFGDEAERLPSHAKVNAVAVSGRARLTSWTGRDGTERHGVSVAAEQITSAKSRHGSPDGRDRAAGARAAPAWRSYQLQPARAAAEDGRPFCDGIPI